MKLDHYKGFDMESARKLILQALKEDIGRGDITTETLISKNDISKAVIKVKDEGIIAGLKIFAEVFNILDKKVKIKFFKEDGDKVKQGVIVGEIHGNTQSLLKGERTALNILQRMSGIASQTWRVKSKLGNNKVKVIDTRKTTPNFRLFEKLAVKMGGGSNHRFGLYDMMLIKDNHIEANGGIENTLLKLEKIKKRNIKTELEVKDIKELKIVLASKKGIVNRVMLDNFKINDVKEAVNLNKGRFELEISGGVNENNIGRYKNIKGLDYISLGSLTHSVKSLDISLDFIT